MEDFLSDEEKIRQIEHAIQHRTKLQIRYKNKDGQEKIHSVFVVGPIKPDLSFTVTSSKDRDGFTMRIDGIISINDESNTNVLTPYEELKATKPEITPVLQPRKKQSIPSETPVETFSQVTNNAQWSDLIHYYRECLYQEYLLNYVIKKPENYQFVEASNDEIIQVLAGRASFKWEQTLKGQQTGIAKFITDSSRKQQQQRLCIAYRTFYIHPERVIPVIFAECKHAIQDNKVIVTVEDKYELNYALLEEFDLDRDFFDEILQHYSDEDAESAIPHIVEASIRKLEKNNKQTIQIYDAPFSEKNTPRNTLLTNPCLFWVSSHITANLLKELEALSEIPYADIPSSINRLLNLSGEFVYPQPATLDKDERFYVTPINDEQRQACESALISPMTVITGPPGTGKSQLILNVIANAVVQGQSVLFASRINNAVDVVIDRAKPKIRGVVRTGKLDYISEAQQYMKDVLDHLEHYQMDEKSWWYQESYQQERTELKRATDRVEEIYEWERQLDDLSQSMDIHGIDFQRLSSKKHLGEIRIAIENAKYLEEYFRQLGLNKRKVENVLDEHIRQNRHDYSIINAIQAVNGFRFLFDSHFSDIQSLQNHLHLWLHLIEAYEKRKLYESRAEIVNRLEIDVAGRIEKLNPHFKSLVDNRMITEVEIPQFQIQVQALSQAIQQAKSRTRTNWFGFRRHKQNQAILLGLNDLLSQLIQPRFEDKVTVKRLEKRLNEARQFCDVMVSVYKLDKQKQQLQSQKNELDSIVESFSDEVRRNFWFINVQQGESNFVRLRQILDECHQKLGQARHSCEEFTQTLEAFIYSVVNIPHLNWGWGDNIEQLTHTLNQWKIIIFNMGIEADGGKSIALDRADKAWESITDKAIQVIKSNWVERSHKALDNPYNSQQIRNRISSNPSPEDKTFFYKVFPIWATTNLSMKQIHLSSEAFDLVVIDEASQCDIPSALPLLYRAKRVVIIGDDKQLTHITTLPEERDKELSNQHGVGENYRYTQKSLFQLARDSVTSRPGVIDLIQHYRSHRDIIQFSNQTFYDNRLDIRTDLRKRNIPSNILDKSGIVWINVQGNTQHPSNGSAFNEHEIRVIEDLLNQLHQTLKRIDWGYDSIGIVTPYREQKERLLKIKSLNGVTVGTAHTFQGNECEIMLFSTVLSEGISEGSHNWLSKSQNLLNVAVTRARTMLVVVGDFDYCRKLDSEHLYRRFAEYVGQSRVFSNWTDLPLLKI